MNMQTGILGPPYFPVIPAINVAAREKTKKTKCETGFLRLRTLYS
jgi:hypothetical protein